MKAPDQINLIGGLLDLPIMDSDGHYCGIVDDIELERTGDAGPRVRSLLVGPGAYAGRLPAWAFRLATITGGRGITRVPWTAIAKVDSAVRLAVTADALGLHTSENRVRALIPRWGAM